MPTWTKKNVLRSLLSKLRRDKDRERDGEEHLPHLHLRLKDAVLSSSPMGRTRQ